MQLIFSQHDDVKTIVFHAYCKYTTFLGQGSKVEQFVTVSLYPV